MDRVRTWTNSRAGLYETLVTEQLADQIEGVSEDLVSVRDLKPDEVPDRLALHVAKLIEGVLSDVPEEDRAAAGNALVHSIVGQLGQMFETDSRDDLAEPASILRAVLLRNPDGTAQQSARPLLSLLDTTLLTNSPGEPNLWSQLLEESRSADAIDVIMAFIRRSGIAPLVDCLRRHCDEGKRLRILTTTYTGSTEQAALEQLKDLGAQIRKFLRSHLDSSACQGLAVPSRNWILDWLYWFIKSYVFGASDRPRVEHPCLFRSESRCTFQIRCRLRELLAEQRLHCLRRRRVQSGVSAERTERPRTRRDLGRDRASTGAFSRTLARVH